jgi:hypothetical protein
VILGRPASGRQRQRPQFFPRRSKGAKLIDRGAIRRERELLEWLGQHLVQIGFRPDTDRHMRIETLARRDVGGKLLVGFKDDIYAKEVKSRGRKG